MLDWIKEFKNFSKLWTEYLKVIVKVPKNNYKSEDSR